MNQLVEKMRKLTSKEVEKLTSRKGVRKIAVENFLLTMGTDLYAAEGNLRLDKSLYKWNAATVRAICSGIDLACK